MAARETSFCGCSWVDRRAARERSEYQTHMRAFVEDVHKVALTHNDVGVTRAALLENLTWAPLATRTRSTRSRTSSRGRRESTAWSSWIRRRPCSQHNPFMVSVRQIGVDSPRSAQSPLAVFERPHGRFVHAGDPLK